MTSKNYGEFPIIIIEKNRLYYNNFFIEADFVIKPFVRSAQRKESMDAGFVTFVSLKKKQKRQFFFRKYKFLEILARRKTG